MTEVASYDKLFIGGDWVPSTGTSTFELINPSTEEWLARVPEGTRADMDRAVSSARDAFDHGPWPQMSPKERGAVLSSVSSALGADVARLGELLSAEMGSPVSWSMMGQVMAPIMIAEQFVTLSDTYPFTEIRAGVFAPSEVRKVPVGVVAAIIPWNVPLFAAIIKLGPALVAGCTVVLKPSPETPLSAFELAKMLSDAGLPPGVVNVVPAGREVGEYLVTHPDVDKVSFTGSTMVGRRLGALCGELLRPLTLELGGKSAAIVLQDADLEAAVAGIVPNGIMNNGQACVAQTRILAPRARYTEIVDALSEAVGALQVGDALDPATEVGPLVAERQRERVLDYINIGRQEGAQVTVGGARPDIEKGWFVQPTVFAQANNSMRIAREEIFGPVLTVIPYDGVDDAVSIANDSDYGLSGSVWGADSDEAAEVGRRIRTGTMNINTFMLDFGSPFGGFKSSGLGRELGPEGLEAYLLSQSIAFAPTT